MPAPFQALRTLLPSTMAIVFTVVSGCSSDQGTTHGIDFETSEGTKLAFDVSPDGQTIVVDLLGQLWTLPVEGGRAVPLTDAVRDSSEDLDPAFAPDGGSIVFRADRPGGPGLFSVSLGDQTIRRLTDQPHVEPSWSPDGQQLAFVQGQRIQLLDLAGGDPRALQIDSLPPPGASQPAWSPTDGRLVFVNAPQGAPGRLWEVEREGGVARPLSDVDLRARAPVYSPGWESNRDPLHGKSTGDQEGSDTQAGTLHSAPHGSGGTWAHGFGACSGRHPSRHDRNGPAVGVRSCRRTASGCRHAANRRWALLVAR
jgi:Tol biopolymer transport system component